MLSLIIDNRERAIFPFLDMEIKSFLYEKKQLNTGDFLIIKTLPERVNNYEIKACIERKTYIDFAASFRDGRYKSELNNMLELRKKINCQLFFIIEGTAFPSMNRTFSRIPYVCILGAINKLMLRHNIFIIQTENEQHTARKLNELLTSYTLIMEEAESENAINIAQIKNTNADIAQIKNTNTDNENAEDANNKDADNEDGLNNNKIGGSTTIMTNKSLTQRIQKTDEDILLKAWASLKGISLVLGKLLMERFTIKDLALGIISIEEIKTFKTAFGKTINKTAIDSLISIRNGNTKNCAKMLSAIIGITVDFATKLFNIKSLKEICQYYQNSKDPIDYTYLSDIVINEKKVGPKKAINIYKLIYTSI